MFWELLMKHYGIDYLTFMAARLYRLSPMLVPSKANTALMLMSELATYCPTIIEAENGLVRNGKKNFIVSNRDAIRIPIHVSTVCCRQCRLFVRKKKRNHRKTFCQ